MGTIEITANERELIRAFAKHIGLQETRTSLVFLHPYFGTDVLIDLSASHSDKWAIMDNVFSAAVKFGKDQKTKEIKHCIGIK